MNRTILISAIWLMSVSVQSPCPADSPTDGKALAPRSLELTVRRYFAGMAGYEEGDLICSSQVAELQQYLRKTSGHTAASHARMQNQVLPDDSRLTRLFYAKRGAKVLRVAAKKLHGYSELDRLSRTDAGYVQLVEAIKSDSADQLVKQVAVKSEFRPTAETEENQQEHAPRRYTRIYTLDEFLAAVLAPSDGEQSATGQQQSER